MAPEVREVVDILVPIIGGGGLGGLLLGIFGHVMASRTAARQAAQPPNGAPTVGPHGLAAIGGMVMGTNVATQLVEAVNGLSEQHERGTRVMRNVVDQLDTLNDRLKDRRDA